MWAMRVIRLKGTMLRDFLLQLESMYDIPRQISRDPRMNDPTYEVGSMYE